MRQTKSKICVILAAGEGKRMHAPHSKVLCEVTKKPLLRWVIDAAADAGIENICVVASSDDVKSEAEGLSIREQKERLGTGHAVMCAKDFLESSGISNTLVLCGDAPFIDSGTILGALAQHEQDKNAVTVIGAKIDDASGYGRILRNNGALTAIVEEADCDDETRLIKEINSGAYWFDTESLVETLGKLKNNNAQSEYYLTDAIEILISEGKSAGCFTAASHYVALGANKPADLLRLNEIACELVVNRHLEAGVHFIKRDGIMIGPDVKIEPGATILPGTMLFGKTEIGSGSVIGPNSVVNDTVIGRGCVFNSSQSDRSDIADGAKIGPYVQLRPDSHIGKGVKIGDFVEIKNSTIGEGTSVAHLTYVGDSDVGRFCNFGCGVVFVNYDGEKKCRSTIKDYAFVGCNTNIIAPVTIGEGAYTAAGTTVNKDVPDGALAIGRADQRNIEGWAARKLKAYIDKKNKK